MADMKELNLINNELAEWVSPLENYLKKNKIEPTKTQEKLFNDVETFFTQFSKYKKKPENEMNDMELAPVYRTIKKISESLKLIFDDLDGKTQGNKHLGKAPYRLVENLDTAFDEMVYSLSNLSPEMKEEISKPEVKPIEKAKPSVEAFEDMLKEIDAADPMYIRSSKDFRAAKDAIKDVIKMSKAAPDSFDKNGEILNKKINNKICDALDYAQLYVRNKKNEPNLSDLAKKRIATMEKVVEQLEEQYGLSNIQCRRKGKTNSEAAEKLEEQSQGLIKMGRDLRQNEIAEATAKHKYAQFLKKESADGHYNEIMAMRVMDSLMKKINEATKQNEKAAEANQKQKKNDGPSMGF